jgi:hypothetical protein
MPIPARVEREAFVPAVLFTTLQMTPEGRGAAVGDIPEDLALFGVREMGLQIGLPVAPQDLGQLYGGRMRRGQLGSAVYLGSLHG